MLVLHRCPGTWPLSESRGSRALSTSNFASNSLCVSEWHRHHFLKLLAGLNFWLSFQWWQTKQGLSSPCKQRWELSDGVTVGVLPRPGTAAQTFPSVSSCKDTLINCSCWVSFYKESFYYMFCLCTGSFGSCSWTRITYWHSGNSESCKVAETLTVRAHMW